MSLFEVICGDYICYGCLLIEVVFVFLVVYCYGCWVIGLNNLVVCWVVQKFYVLMKIFILNVIKVWILLQVKLGEDFYIIYVEGLLLIYFDVVIGD